MKILIQNTSILIGDKFTRSDVCIEKGRIKKLGKDESFNADLVIDGKGLATLPAFVDMHCHLRDPGFTHKEDIISGAKSAAAGGFCDIACMPNTNPPLDSSELISYVLSKAKDCAVRVHPIGCITRKSAGEQLAPFGALKNAGAVAVSDDGKPVSNGAIMKNALEYAATFNLPLIAHSEDLSLSAGGIAHDGHNAAMMGLRGIPRAAEEAGIARDILLADETKTPIHIAHLSTKNSVDIVRQAKKRGVLVTAETCPHYFAATDELLKDFNTNAKINPPLREQSDVLAIIDGLCDGTINAIATDHAPHHLDEKNVEFADAAFGSIGFETAFAVSYTHLVKSGRMKMGKLIKLMSTAPAEILGLNAPSLLEGKNADLVIADLNHEFIYDAKLGYSKAQNSVFNGAKLFGKIKYTIINGRVAFLGE